MVSIVVPAFNVGDYLDECISSILRQTYADLEVIIVDDGSDDCTSSIASGYCDRDGRVSLVSKPHSNAGESRNMGLCKSSGDYLLFFDADDRMPPDMVELLVERANETDADVVCCRSRSFEDGKDGYLPVDNGPHIDDYSIVCSGAELGDGLWVNFMGWPWDKLFRRSFVMEKDLAFQSLSSSNDASFVFCALALADRVAFVDSCLPEHRKRAGSIEKTRQLTPHNARACEREIHLRLSNEPVWDSVRLGFYTWCLSHLRWNYTTLDLPERLDAFDDYLDALSEAQSESAPFPTPIDRRIAVALHDAELSTPEMVIANQAHNLVSLEQRRDALNERCRNDAARIKRLERENENLRMTNEYLSNDLSTTVARLKEADDYNQALLHSLSFRVGRGLTLVPRTVRESIKSIISR